MMLRLREPFGRAQVCEFKLAPHEGELMPLYFLQTRNSDFCARDAGSDHDTPEAALALGVRSAALMVADEIGRGSQAAAIEVNVEQANGSRLLTSVVAISVSRLTMNGFEELSLPGDDLGSTEMA